MGLKNSMWRQQIILLSLLTFSSWAQLPDPIFTPGDTVPVALTYICNPRFLETPKISNRIVWKVFKDYGIPYRAQKLYALDFLIPINLGGAATAENIWPQELAGPWGHNKKIILDNCLNLLVCRKQLSLQEAREILKESWIRAYLVYVDSGAAEKPVPLDSFKKRTIDELLRTHKLSTY
jgi:hypothetical protein